jgi:hypothetical protein
MFNNEQFLSFRSGCISVRSLQVLIFSNHNGAGSSTQIVALEHVRMLETWTLLTLNTLVIVYSCAHIIQCYYKYKDLFCISLQNLLFILVH